MKVIFVFAHPDDESFSSGGTIAMLSKKGVTIKLITATKGEAGQIGSPPVCKKEELGKCRELELKKAAKILGISEIFFLKYKDGELPKISIKVLGEEVFEILKKENPDVVITFNREGGSKHPDHIRISKVTTFAFQKYIEVAKKHVKLYFNAVPRTLVRKLEKDGMAYTAFGKVNGTPNHLISTVIDIEDTIEIKIKALKAHKSQRQDWERHLKRRDYKEFKKEFFRLIMENNIF